MSRTESRMTVAAMARSNSWLLWVMLVCLVGCGKRAGVQQGAQSSPDDRATRQRLGEAMAPYHCSDGGTDDALNYVLDVTPNGAVVWDAGCVDPAGMVTFSSHCLDGGVTFVAYTDGGIVPDAGAAHSCTGSGTLQPDRDSYTISLLDDGDTCALGIANDATGSLSWTLQQNDCQQTVTPIKGTVEVATTGPDEEGDGGRR